MGNKQSFNENQETAKRLTTDVGKDLYLDIKEVQINEKFKKTSIAMNFLMRLGLTIYKEQKANN